MKSLLSLRVAPLFLPLLTACCWAAEPGVLWYEHPAGQWTEALPVGNGRLGAMAYGGIREARWQFNEDSVWTGGPHSYAREGASRSLAKLRELLLTGDQRAAEELAMREFMSDPVRQRSYQPCGDLVLTLDHPDGAEDYRRELNLDAATMVTRYRIGDTTFTRTTFASYPDDAVVIQLECDQPGELSFLVNLTSPHKRSKTSAADANTLLLDGKVGQSEDDKIRFAVHARIIATDGQIESSAGLSVSNASRATLLLTARTNHLNFRDVTGDAATRSAVDLAAAAKHDYRQLLARHTADHKSLYDRVRLTLEGDSSELPTDQWVLASEGKADPALAELLFDYGRYLMIASSRPGGQPANLQGLWNDQLAPPWDSKYTININTEMNYWLTDPCNLPECARPLFEAIAEVSKSGTEVARQHYNGRGWVVHHNFDLWRGAAPINASNHGIWPTGGAWLCQHLWNRYAFSGDEEFLRETAYPLLRGASQFFAGYLIEDPRVDHVWLISGPSNSPEQGGLVMGPAMDHQIIRALFEYTIEASRTLNVDGPLREQLQSLHDRIAPNQIGQHGQLQEWLEDKDDPNNRHRHVSHLWAVFPGSEITPDTPELFDAARTSLEFRGDGGTGWARAWKINLWARLRDGNRAEKVLRGLLTLTDSPLTKYRGGGVYANLFDAHPPFQIDGNFGATSGVCEMLLQSHRTSEDGQRLIEILPALPSAWPNGEVEGICSRDGFSLNIQWSEGSLRRCEIRSTLPRSAVFACGGQRQIITMEPGDMVTLGHDLATIATD